MLVFCSIFYHSRYYFDVFTECSQGRKKKKNIFALSLFNDATGHWCWVTVVSCHMQHKCGDVRLSQHIVSSSKDHNIKVLVTRKVRQSDVESRRR